MDGKKAVTVHICGPRGPLRPRLVPAVLVADPDDPYRDDPNAPRGLREDLRWPKPWGAWASRGR